MYHRLGRVTGCGNNVELKGLTSEVVIWFIWYIHSRSTYLIQQVAKRTTARIECIIIFSNINYCLGVLLQE